MFLSSSAWQDYGLLDSGGSAKLERFGAYSVVRPDAGATWARALDDAAWAGAHAAFVPGKGADVGTWRVRAGATVPARWQMRCRDVTFWARLTPYKHLGVFPEQAAHWDWFRALIQARTVRTPVRVLNLFAYTGLATLFAAAGGAHVTHVDAAKNTVAWARENAALSGLADAPVRWLVDDTLKFAQREVRRGARYDGIILDPPPVGHGPNGETWRFDRSLPVLLDACARLLSDAPLFVVLTAYTEKTSDDALRAMVGGIVAGHSGTLEAGTVGALDGAGRQLPLALFARWRTAASHEA